MVASYLWVWLRARLGWPLSEERLSRVHTRHARRFKKAASRLKGGTIKLGQLASLQPHVLPEEYVDEFKSLRDEVTPTPWPQIDAMLRDQLGPSLESRFSDIETEPIAAASMAQVHAATLPNGDKVAVKVLHPGLETSVEVDLWLTRRLVAFFQFFFPRWDLWQLYREIEGPLREELDLLAEGRATEVLGAEVADLDVIVPQIHWGSSTRRVLTMSFIEGVPISDRAQLDAWNVDRHKLASVYLRAFFRQAFEGGHFHCDPHPANVFCTPEGQLAMLDFGMVKRMPEVVRNGLVKEILGAFLNNPDLYADGLIDRGVVQERERERVLEFARETFADEAMRATIFDHDPQGDGDVKLAMGRINGMLKSLETFCTPQDQVMFMRALGIVIDVCREVYPEESPSELARPIVIPILPVFLQKNPEYMPWAAEVMKQIQDEVAARRESQPPATGTAESPGTEPAPTVP